MKIDFLQPRKLTWPINAIIYNVCRLYPFRNKHIWVFGALNGNGYDDNAKYLFEYINEKHTDEIVSVWISEKTDIVGILRRKGYNAYLTYSWRGIYYALRCGVAIYTHGLSDFGYIPLVGGARIVSLWHGVGFKKIYNASYHGTWQLLKMFADNIFNWTKRHYTMVTSEYTKQQFKVLFNLNVKGIYITGQPRNDVFKKNIDFASIRKRLSISQDYKVILYMPTYRNKWQGDKVIDDIIKNLVSNNKLNEVLKQNKYVIVIKLHPITSIPQIVLNKNFRMVKYDEIDSNQELLALGDMLITDYSSCYVDYSLLNRPVIFYVPDMEEYLKSTGGLDDEYFNICNICKCETPENLSELLLHPSNKVAEVTNRLFEDTKIHDTCYCENVYKVIKNEMNL